MYLKHFIKIKFPFLFEVFPVFSVDFVFFLVRQKNEHETSQSSLSYYFDRLNYRSLFWKRCLLKFYTVCQVPCFRPVLCFGSTRDRPTRLVFVDMYLGIFTCSLLCVRCLLYFIGTPNRIRDQPYFSSFQNDS